MKIIPDVTGNNRLRVDENTQCYARSNPSSRHHAANDAVMEKPPARSGKSGLKRQVENHDTRQVAMFLHSLFRDLTSPLQMRLWDGSLLELGRRTNQNGQAAPYELHCKHPRALRAMALSSDPLSVAEAYFRDDIDVSGDFFAAIRLKDHLAGIRPSLMQRIAGFVQLLNWSLLQAKGKSQPAPTLLAISQPVRKHSRAENKASIAFHYDVSNHFYALWLDAKMVYSCAYFESEQDTLEQAQTQKLDHICRKLLLRPGDHLLDIGCGWGALAIHAARHYGAKVHGITLSREQWEWANASVRREGLHHQIHIDLCDYRDLMGSARYDKISSVGMFEHVGLRNLNTYFSTIFRLLKSNGLVLNHGITHEEEGWGRSLSSRFINRYVFPDGELDTVSNIQRVMEHCDFEIADVENLRQHYALTLRHWVKRLEECRPEALQHVSESTWRVWRLFMASSALEFESGELGLYQILATKRDGVPLPLPLTRRHLYCEI